jgi:hypothetical protein
MTAKVQSLHIVGQNPGVPIPSTYRTLSPSPFVLAFYSPAQAAPRALQNAQHLRDVQSIQGIKEAHNPRRVRVCRGLPVPGCILRQPGPACFLVLARHRLVKGVTLANFPDFDVATVVVGNTEF